MTLVTNAKRSAVLSLVTMTMPAMAIDYQANLEGLLAFSASQYSSDVSGDDFNGHSNGSFAGVSLSATQSAYQAFFIYQYGFERFNESVPNTVPGEREREFFGGVSTPYGTLGYGRQESFYRKTGREVDPFHDSSVPGFNGVFAAEGASYGLSNLSNGFNDETLAYASPSYAGLSLRASYFMDKANDEDEDYGLGLRYAPEDSKLSAGVEYLDSRGGDAVFGVGKGVPYDALRVYGSYRWQAFALGASFEQVDVENETDRRKYALLSASYTIRSRFTLASGLGLLKDVVPNAAANSDGIDGKGLSFGAFYEATPRFTTYAAVRSVQLDSDADTETYAIGASYAFSYTLFP